MGPSAGGDAGTGGPSYNWDIPTNGIGTITPFSYEAETTAYLAQAGASFPDAHKPWINKLIKRLKGYGVYSKLDHLYVFCVRDGTDALIDIINPASSLTNSGSTFTADSGYTGASIPTSISTDVDTFGIFVKHSSATVSDADAELTGLNPKNASNVIEYRGTTVGVGAQTTGKGCYCVSTSGSVASVYRNGTFIADVAKVAPSGNFTIAAASSRTVQAAWMGDTLTATEVRNLYGAIGDYIEAITYGVYDFQNAGIGDTTVTADVIVYGTTSQGIFAAYEAARQGASVAICGGWRDRMIGGTTNGGLGHMDIHDLESYGGLPRWCLTKTNDLMGRPSTNQEIEVWFWRYALRYLLDPARNGGYTIPIYYSNGVETVNKTGTVITSIVTVDGRTFNGLQFIDASYENDLMLRAATVTKGREARGSGEEVDNGFRGIDAGSTPQMKIGSSYYDISPFIIDGDSGSGYLPDISRSIDDCPAVGSADDQMQSYCFRQMVSIATISRAAFTDGVEPDDYDPIDYEPLARLMAAHPTMTMFNVVNLDYVRTGNTADVNSGGGWSTNLWGGSKNYALNTYAQREIIWKRHLNRQIGFWHFLQYEADSRIPSSIRLNSVNYGFHNEHLLDHHENDPMFYPPQLYVRECWRLVGDIVWDGNDINTDYPNDPYRSVKPIGLTSYTKDSHHTEALHDPNGGNDRIWLTGNFLSGAPDSQIPYECLIPKRADCTNAFCCFGISSTHVAMGAIRMEMSSSACAQAAGAAAALAIDQDVDVQDVDYDELVLALEGSPSLTSETPPILVLPSAFVFSAGEGLFTVEDGAIDFPIGGGPDPTDVASVDFWGDASALPNGLVATWPNQISGGLDAVQASSSLQPNVISGDMTWSADALHMNDDMSAGTEFSGGMVITPNITGGRRYLIDQSPGSAGMFVRIDLTTNKVTLTVFTNAGTITATAPTALVDSQTYTIGWRCKSGNIEIYVDGVANSQVVTTTYATITSAASDDVFIGASIASAEGYSGIMKDVWMSYDTSVNDTDFNFLQNYIADNNGANWTDI